MRVIEPEEAVGPVFVEGEPDLEPPEELAVEVLDEHEMAQDDVDCELVDESELDQELAEEAFDDLVHAGDESDDDPATSPDEFLCQGCYQVQPRRALADPVAVLCHACTR